MTIRVFKLCLFIDHFWYLRVKKSKGTDYVIAWKLKGLIKSNPLLLHGAFLLSIKYLETK